jgi:hypothetical protein
MSVAGGKPKISLKRGDTDSRNAAFGNIQLFM